MPHPDYPDTRPRCPQTGMFLPWEEDDHRPWSGRGRGHQVESNPEDYESDEYEDDEELEWDEGDDDDDDDDEDDDRCWPGRGSAKVTQSLTRSHRV